MYNNHHHHTQQHGQQLTAMRKCASTPTLRSLGDLGIDGSGGMEVYVVLRNFQEFAGGIFHRLPRNLRDGVRDSGVCHYMTVFRQPDGSLVMFDFGPSAGGDIHVSRGPLARLLGKSTPRRTTTTTTTTTNGGIASVSANTTNTTTPTTTASVAGKVRERKLTALPDCHLFVGRTHLSMTDIRAWNSVHAATAYELHRSDCRHYVNSLVHYSTGVERATASALRHQWANNRHRYGIAERVVRMGQYMTDAANWDKVKAVGHATTAVVMACMGHHALAKIRSAPLLQSVQRRLLPAARRALQVPVPRALLNINSQRPAVAVGAASAVATTLATGVATGHAPAAVRDTLTLGARVAGGMQSAVRAAASLAEHFGRSASAATQQTTSHAVALASGIAGVASRGASTIMVARPRARRTVVAATVVGAPPPLQGTTATASRGGGPLRAILPSLQAKKIAQQQLAMVASRGR